MNITVIEVANRIQVIIDKYGKAGFYLHRAKNPLKFLLITSLYVHGKDKVDLYFRFNGENLE